MKYLLILLGFGFAGAILYAIYLKFAPPATNTTRASTPYKPLVFNNDIRELPAGTGRNR